MEKASYFTKIYKMKSHYYKSYISVTNISIYIIEPSDYMFGTECSYFTLIKIVLYSESTSIFYDLIDLYDYLNILFRGQSMLATQFSTENRKNRKLNFRKIAMQLYKL